MRPLIERKRRRRSISIAHIIIPIWDAVIWLEWYWLERNRSDDMFALQNKRRQIWNEIIEMACAPKREIFLPHQNAFDWRFHFQQYLNCCLQHCCLHEIQISYDLVSEPVPVVDGVAVVGVVAAGDDGDCCVDKDRFALSPVW